jgi:predicted phage terminase large subunit-like protein
MLQFLHLQHESTVFDHQSKQYALIIFDELTHFEESQFWYMVSRMRSTCGVRPYMRCATNPDPDSFVRKLIEWWIGPDGLPIKERCGVLRWFVRIQDELHWGDSPEELQEAFPGHNVKPMSLTFIAAKLEDNPALTSKDPDYDAKLLALPLVEQQQLRGGDWNARPEGGKYIRAAYLLRRWTTRPLELNVYITSDFAVAEKEEKKDPDFTEHAVWGLNHKRELYVLDWWYGQTTPNVWIERLLDLIEKWQPLCYFGENGVIRHATESTLVTRSLEREIYFVTEWVTHGTSVSGTTATNTAAGYEDRSKRAKAARGRPFQARAAMSKIILPESAPWLEHVEKQWVSFPRGHDDAFDAASLMCSVLDQAHPAIVIPEEPKPRERDYDRGSGNRSGRADWKTA